jgi:PAS domain S-box-containing protein
MVFLIIHSSLFSFLVSFFFVSGTVLLKLQTPVKIIQMSDKKNEKKINKKIIKLNESLAEYKRISARFQAIFNAIPYATVFTDSERRIILSNPAVEKIFGYTQEEVVGKETEVFYTSKEVYEEQGRVRFNLTAKEKLSPYKVNYRKKDKTIFRSETVGTVVKDEEGTVIGFLGLMRDLSKQRKESDKLQELELKYRTVADFTYDWEYWIRPDGTFRYMSPSCERITGYKPEQFFDNPILLREIVVLEDRDIWDKHCSDSVKELRLRELQFRIEMSSGEVRWIEHACQPVMGGNDELLGFRASNRDITKRKKVEDELLHALEEINELKEQLEAESFYLREEINLEHNFTNIVGNSNALQYVFFKVEQIATTDTSVLILGETGTGKELIARAIHNTSLRSERPLVKINCAALPANLIESELFGHEKGAYTSAESKRLGRFEVADGATLFLDEIGELPLELQAKLLRILQDGEFERLGSSKTIKVDVRVIAATNRNLEEDVRNGRFRQDLWYRLNVFPITSPPLRDRLDDIPLLVKFFVENFSRKQGKEISSIPASVITKLTNYSWPGNIRELENVIERAVINTPNEKLLLADTLAPSQEKVSKIFKSLNDMEREYIIEVLEKVNWKVSGKNSAAEILQLDRSTLRARMKKLGISKP